MFVAIWCISILCCGHVRPRSTMASAWLASTGAVYISMCKGVCISSASVSGFMALLVLWFFIKSFIHSFIRSLATSKQGKQLTRPRTLQSVNWSRISSSRLLLSSHPAPPPLIRYTILALYKFICTYVCTYVYQTALKILAVLFQPTVTYVPSNMQQTLFFPKRL